MKANELSNQQQQQLIGRKVKVMPNGSGQNTSHGQVAKVIGVHEGRFEVKPPNHKRTERVDAEHIHIWQSHNKDLELMDDPWVVYDIGHERLFLSPNKGWTHNPEQAKSYESRTGARRAAGHLKQQRKDEVSKYGLTVARLSQAQEELQKIREKRKHNGQATPSQSHNEQAQSNGRPHNDSVANAMSVVMSRIKDVQEAEEMLHHCQQELETAQQDLMNTIREQVRAENRQ